VDQLPRAALGFAGLSRPSYDSSLWALRSWLDSWAGIGHAAGGMARQGYDLQLTRYDERGWRANFYPTGLNDSVVAVRIRAERPALRRILEWRTCIRHRGGHHAQ
jgi:hypothetical protein